MILTVVEGYRATRVGGVVFPAPAKGEATAGRPRRNTSLTVRGMAARPCVPWRCAYVAPVGSIVVLALLCLLSRFFLVLVRVVVLFLPLAVVVLVVTTARGRGRRGGALDGADVNGPAQDARQAALVGRDARRHQGVVAGVDRSAAGLGRHRLGRAAVVAQR